MTDERRKELLAYYTTEDILLLIEDLERQNKNLTKLIDEKDYHIEILDRQIEDIKKEKELNMDKISTYINNQLEEIDKAKYNLETLASYLFWGYYDNINKLVEVKNNDEQL